MITKEQAIELGLRGHGELHYGNCVKHVGPRGGVTLIIVRWRVNGKCHTWVTQPERFGLPIKHGIYSYSYLTDSNAHQFHLENDCPLLTTEVKENG